MVSTRVQLSLHAKKLANVGTLKKPNPYAIVAIPSSSSDTGEIREWEVIGETEVVISNSNPTWSKVFILDYTFSRESLFEVRLYHASSKNGSFRISSSSCQEFYQTSERSSSSDNLIAQDRTTTSQQQQQSSSSSLNSNLSETEKPPKLLGSARFEVGEILGKRNNVVSRHIQTNDKKSCSLGRMCAMIEKSGAAIGNLLFQIRGIGLKNRQSDLLNRRSDPFFEISRKQDLSSGATWNVIYRSRPIKSNLNPMWEKTIIDLESFCNNDLERSIKVSVYDFRRTGKHKSMGSFETTVSRFVDAKSRRGNADLERAFTLLKDGKDVGKVVVVEARVLDCDGKTESERDIVREERRPKFTDYLFGGCEISLSVAIDFTSSNGDPRTPGTAHYLGRSSQGEMNDYEKAIFAVGSILAKYDSDQKFPVWGFGAKYDNVRRDCFQCGPKVEVHGVQGILDAYRSVFQTPLIMSCPTVLTDVIRTAAFYASRAQEEAITSNKLSYSVLLILTTGNLHDPQTTKLELAKASAAPLSVVIVGIGNSNFSKMRFLDEHDPTTEFGRDITQFVEFQLYRQNLSALTDAVIEEIPDQLVDYFVEKGIRPGVVEDREKVMKRGISMED